MRLPLRAWFAALRAGFSTTGGLSASSHDLGFSASPQFGDDRRFHNTPNPDAKPSKGGLANWAKFLLGSKVGTEPIDRIPMRMLDRPSSICSIPKPRMWCGSAIRRTC